MYTHRRLTKILLLIKLEYKRQDILLNNEKQKPNNPAHI